MSVFFLLFCPLKNAYKLSFPLPLWDHTEGQRPSEATVFTPKPHLGQVVWTEPRGIYSVSCLSRSIDSVQWTNSWELSQSHIRIFLSLFNEELSTGGEISPQRLKVPSSPSSEPRQHLCHLQTSAAIKQHHEKFTQHVLEGSLRSPNVGGTFWTESLSICLLLSFSRLVPRPWRGASKWIRQFNGRDNLSKKVSSTVLPGSVFCSLSFNTFNSALEENINHLQ